MVLACNGVYNSIYFVYSHVQVMVEFAIGPAYQDRGVENEILPQMLSDQLSAGSKFNSIFASPTSIQEQVKQKI